MGVANMGRVVDDSAVFVIIVVRVGVTVGVAGSDSGVAVGTKITTAVDTTDVAVIVGGTGVFVDVVVTAIVSLTVADGAGVAVSSVAGIGLWGTSKSASSGVVVLVGSHSALGGINGMAVAEALSVGVGDGVLVGVASGLVTVSVAGPLIGAILHGVSVVAVICWPAAMITSSWSVITWATPVSVSIWVCVSESTSTVSLLYLAEATAAGVRISKRSAWARGVLTS
jgi:hypothetical protein